MGATLTVRIASALLFAPSIAFAQDAALTDAALVAPGPAPAPSSGGCQADPVPAGHEVTVETVVAPSPPSVGDRVTVTYRVVHHGGDAVEFDPDPAAFAQPGIELEYARHQPDRDRTPHSDPRGRTYSETVVAVQPFATGDVVIAPQLARLRAAGDVIRVCTPEVRFRVHDPFGNETHPRPHDITTPVEVTEDSLRWRWFALAMDIVFAVVVATLAVSAWWRARPKPVVPPPPPRPAWLVALEGLDALGRSDLLTRGQTKDWYDGISDVVRRYVGARAGFDALEMTTDEVLAHVKRSPLPGVTPAEIAHLLGECDLVKFAAYVPAHEQSDAVLAQAYLIVRRSSPSPGAPLDPPANPPANPSPTTPSDARRA